MAESLTSQSPDPEFISQLAARYKDFEAAIDSLAIFNFQTAEDYLNHPAYVGNDKGGNKYQAAFAFESDADGKKFVVRTPNLTDQNRTPESIALRAKAYAERRDALARGSGVAGLEQVVALSPDKQAIVTEFAPGKPLSDLSHDDFYAIPRRQWTQLWESVKAASEHNIALDEGYKMSNLFYDTEQGFTIIDYETPPALYASPEELYEANIFALAQVKSWSALSADQFSETV